MAFNTYSKSADFYDLDPRVIHSADLNFYLDLAKSVEPPVLELACGTGRIAIPIAKAGTQIFGLDLSDSMLDVFTQKLKSEASEVAKRIVLQKGDMVSFDLNTTFGMIFIPFRSFQALTRRDDQLSCLKCVRAHLKEKGQFVLNVFRPYSRLDQSWESEPVLDWEVTDNHTGKKVARRHWRKKIDVEKQILEIDMIFSIGNEKEFVDHLKLKYFYQNQIEDLLIESGFEIIRKLGDYDGRPIGSGGELIYLCVRSKK